MFHLWSNSLENAPRKADICGPSIWVDATHVGDPVAVSHAWLQPCQILALKGFWRENHRMDYLSLSCPHFLPIYISNKKIKFLLLLLFSTIQFCRYGESLLPLHALLLHFPIPSFGPYQYSRIYF